MAAPRGLGARASASAWKRTKNRDGAGQSVNAVRDACPVERVGEPRLVRPTLALSCVWHPGFLPRLRRLNPEAQGAIGLNPESSGIWPAKLRGMAIGAVGDLSCCFQPSMIWSIICVCPLEEFSSTLASVELLDRAIPLSVQRSKLDPAPF